MINQAKVIALCESFLKDTDNYLIDVKVSASNKILVHIENDKHVSIQDCIALSRFIEHSLDREKEDFELEVSSPGIDQAFRNMRQYQKYAGREVEVRMLNGSGFSGILQNADDRELVLRSTGKKSKKKEKEKVEEELITLSMPEIKETKLKLKF